MSVYARNTSVLADQRIQFRIVPSPAGQSRPLALVRA
jgi:hypothetical protein